MSVGKVSFFDAAEANKRNSILLIAVMLAIFVLAVFALSTILRSGTFGFAIGIIVVLFYSIIVYFKGDSVILYVTGARQATREEYPFLYNVVEGLALASGIPIPKIYVMEDKSPNAFATGRDPKHSSIAVTTGLLSMLKREELEGVLAHEISHIANYDIRFTMLAIVFVGAIALVGDIALRSVFYGFGRRDSRGRGGSGAVVLVALLLAILTPILAQLVHLAISREREYLADANGARLTRYPEGLASALEKIRGAGIPTKSANESTSSLFFSDPFAGKSIVQLFSTHPPIQDRIKRLRGM